MHGDLGRLRLRESGVCGRVESGGSGKEERGVGSWEVRRQVDCGGGGSHGREREEERGVCVFAERDGKQRNEGCGWEGRERSRACFVCEAWSVEGHLRYAERRERIGRPDGRRFMCVESSAGTRGEEREPGGQTRNGESADECIDKFSKSRFAAQSTTPHTTRSSWP